MSEKSLKKNAALNMIKVLMSLLFPLITFPYSSRVLGPVYTGKVNFAQSIVSYFSLVAALGITSYGVREAAKIRDDKTQLSVFTKEILCINIFSMIAAYILFALSLIFVQPFFDYRKLLCICASSIAFTTIGVDWLYTALEEFKYITIRSIMFQFVSLALLFLTVHSQDDYMKYAAINVIACAGSGICNFIHTRRFIDWKTKVRLFPCRHLKPIISFFAMTAAVSIYTVLDTTMLGFIKGDESVGIYSAATKINRIVIMMISAATSVLLPRLSYYAQKENKEDFARLVNKSFCFILSLSVPCAAGLALLAKPVILLLSGQKYADAIPVMQIMNPVIVFIGISGLIGIQIFMAQRKEKLTLLSVILGAVVNFTLNSFLIPKYGAMGAGFATLIAEFCVTFIQIIFAVKYFEWKKVFVCLAQVIAATILMALCVVLVLRVFHSRLSFVVAVFVGGAVYSILLILFKNSLAVEMLGKVLRRNK